MTIEEKKIDVQLKGLENLGKIYHNLSYDQLYQHETNNQECTETANGTLSVDTGRFTGRSPKDKFIVSQSPSDQNIWWGSVNQKIKPEIFEKLYDLVTQEINGKDIYLTDAFCGANQSTRLSVRVISQLAWQSHFCKNMFIRPSEQELKDFAPDFTIINASGVTDKKWKDHGLNSEVFVVFNIEKRLAIIGGTSYGGEMKKGIFSMMHYLLPLKNILSMHCSANKGTNGDTALFFGLSGTGKTTLSTDPNRALIGDDEHGWDDNGIFNFEGGCYAKTINLDPNTEPDIFNAIKRNALLENVAIDSSSKKVDYFNTSKTENGRVSYPIHHIENRVSPLSVGGHPNHIVFLTCDAFGVLPPVSLLTREQAMVHFISGYTAKVAGTERGITEPQATFSACFGGPFLTQHPLVYAKLLGQKMDTHNARVWLVNTGWSGGGYGVGKRMSLPITRKIISAIIDGKLNEVEYKNMPIFDLAVPQSVPEVDSHLLNPINTWEDKESFNKTCKKLAQMFEENYKKFS